MTFLVVTSFLIKELTSYIRTELLFQQEEINVT